MRILSMTATFGKLEHCTLTLKPGLNVINAPNEWGKSTWCAFILAMLYGLDTRTRTTGKILSEKEKYRPWSGSPMEGQMDLVWRGRNITLQRRTTGRVPLGDFRAYETDTGLPIQELTVENCGLVLLGVERSVFQRTGFIRLEELPVTQDEALRRRLNSLVTTGDESQTGDLLATKLRDLKNRCRHNHTGFIPQAERELAACTEKQAQIAQLRRRQAHLEQQLGSCKAQVETLDAHCQSLQAQTLREATRHQTQQEEKAHRPEKARAASKFRMLLGLGIFAAAMFVFLILRSRPWLAIGFGLLLLTLGSTLVLHGKFSKKPVEMDDPQACPAIDRDPAAQDQSPPPVDGMPDPYAQAQVLLTQARQHQQQLHLALGQCQGQLQALGEENLDTHIAALEQRLVKLRQTEAALDLALETLDIARQTLQRRFSPKLSQLALTLFSQLTGDRYEALALDEALSVTIRAKGEATMRTPLWYSSGTTDQLYLALRLAAAQLLIPEAPVVLDDALARFDLDRRENAMAVLQQYGEKAQVILFTSSASQGTP